ncbi:C45 family autoproteolytic acyltransferase/hydolase [Bhargavaea cecembensis]|uniref:C45 family autoproteolytic acyltransferase/hydolase n=1 Tax=Bhargavaea cecembensis TaxID=394098 RepID=UPI00058D375D|nr:C45 family peptidase [Bhargavaea cecembensis]
MNAYYSDVIQFKGSHYDFGYMQGERLKESPILSRRAAQWAATRKRHFNINQSEAVDLFSRFIPHMLDELQGLADSLGWTMEEALVEFGGYYVETAKSGCSILTGPDFMIRNYDSDPAFYEGRYVIYQPTDGGYATLGPTMQITGRTDGMNEKGLAMGYNFVNRVRSGDGFICNMIGRMVLETCADVREAIALLKEIPHRTSFNYMLTDPAGDTFIVEASPRKVTERRASVSTNHFEILAEENRYRTEDSVRRRDELTDRGDGLDASAAYRLLNGRKEGIFAEKYGASAGTIHTSAYLPAERKALFAIGGNQMPVIFNFGRFLQEGERTNVTRVKGMLDYHKPFINME